MANKDTSLAQAMISFVLHLNWAGLHISNNEDGAQFLSKLRKDMENIQSAMTCEYDRSQLYLSRPDVYCNQIMTSPTIYFSSMMTILTLCALECGNH